MKRYLAFAAGGAVFLVALLITVLFLIPSDVYKTRLVAMVATKTGRTLVIDGPAHFTLFPGIGIDAEDVRFANAPWADKPDMSRAKHIRVSLQWLPLLHGELRINKFTLIHPILHLEVREDGIPNWDFDPPEEATPSTSSAGQSSPAAAPVKGRALTKMGLTAISLQDGFVSYRNKQTHQTYMVYNADVDVAMPNLDGPLTVDGSLIWNDLRVNLALKAATPRAFLAPGTTPLTLSLRSDKLSLLFEGTLAPRESLACEGDITLDVPSIRDFISWTGNALPFSRGFGPFVLKGKVKGDGLRLAFSDARIRFDNINAKGDVALDTSGKRPLIVGRLALDALNLNEYIDASSPRPAPAAQTAQPAPPAPDFSPVTPGTGATEHWSREPIRLDSLGIVNTDLTLSLGSLRWRDLETGATDLTLVMTDGLLAADLKKIALYSGTGKGFLRLDSTGIPALSASFALTGVDVKPLATAATGFDRISGLGNIGFNISANGSNQLEMISTLNGKAEVRISQGNISGISVSTLLRRVFDIVRTRQKGGEVDGWLTGGTRGTDFSELGGSFDIMHGVAANNDFLLATSLLRITGAGKTDIVHQQLDYRLNPTALPGAGKDDPEDVTGITVPLIVEGTWRNPAFRPDIRSLLLNSRETVETIRSLRDLGTRNVLRQLLAPPDAAQGTPGKNDTTPTPKQFLNNPLGR